MNKFNLKPPRRKKRHFCTRSTEHHNYLNLVKDIIPDRLKPHQIWCSDVSYIKFQGGFWYLATIEDAATRQVLAAQVGKYHNSQLVLTAIKQALLIATPQIFHCDQGTEFMAKDCTAYLEERGVKISVSAKASPWENSYLKSFFGRFKDEFGDFNRFNTIGELIEEIYSQIRYYNFERRHSAFKLPPVVYAGQNYSDYCLQKRGTRQPLYMLFSTDLGYSFINHVFNFLLWVFFVPFLILSISPNPSSHSFFENRFCGFIILSYSS